MQVLSSLSPRAYVPFARSTRNHDLAAMLLDMQTQNILRYVHELFDGVDRKCCADCALRHLCIDDHELLAVVAIELRRHIAKRHAIENEHAAPPGCIVRQLTCRLFRYRE